MLRPLRGLHHVTAIASDPQANLDFYTELLGLRLVKQTVNFDDPSSYHFYFGNELGEPGTLLTFFAWPGARQGERGAGQATRVAFSVPAGSLDFWRERLRQRVVEGDEREVIELRDPDGMAIALVADPDAASLPPVLTGQVPAAAAIRALYGVTLAVEDVEATADFLADGLGFARRDAGDPGRFAVGQDHGRRIDVIAAAARGRIAAGSIHHVAFRVDGDAEELHWRRELLEQGRQVSPVMDRHYFHSIYFREPGGVLFEIATDPPGFAIDEDANALGGELKLPPQHERDRDRIMAALPPLRKPQAAPPRAG